MRIQLTECWAAMLQAIPSMSKDKAHALVAQESFSCPRRAFETLNDERTPVETRKLIAQNSFGMNKKGKVSNHPKLARTLFSFLTSRDGSVELDDS